MIDHASHPPLPQRFAGALFGIATVMVALTIPVVHAYTPPTLVAEYKPRREPPPRRPPRSLTTQPAELFRNT